MLVSFPSLRVLTFFCCVLCLVLDLDAISAQWSADEAAFILFKEKQWGPSNWILIAFIPDSGPVQQRTIFGSAIQHVKLALGQDKFGSDKRYAEMSELTWNNVKGLGGGTAEKPWSKREIAQQQLNAAEDVARQEAQAKPASGFHTASYPFTAEASSALQQLKSGEVNWVQLSLDESRKNMTTVCAKQVSATSDLPGLIDAKEPQFYLYNYTGSTLVLVYCCPEAAPQKNRMIYSTCKASLAEELKSSGVAVVKKYDIRDPAEMSTSALNEAMRSASASLFKPDDKPATRAKSYSYGAASASSSVGQFDHSQFQTNKPVFNRPGLNNARSTSGDYSPGSGSPTTSRAAKSAQLKSPAPLAQAMGLASNTGPKKSIVIPPRGAYE